VRKTTCLAGVVTATSGLLLSGVPALADTSDNDGLNIGNDNNASVAPVQACGNNVAVVGAVVPLLSPNTSQCTNAPIADHPSHQHQGPSKPGKDEPAPRPAAPQQPSGRAPQPAPAAEAPSAVAPAASELPAAPSPVAVDGHAAVTG